MSALDASIDADTMERLFQIVLDRPVGDPAFIEHITSRAITVEEILRGLVGSEELYYLWKTRFSGHASESGRLSGAEFRNPSALAVTETHPRNVLVIGSCAVDNFVRQSRRDYPQTHFRYIAFNNGSPLPLLPHEELTAFDFQIVQIPLRGLMPDGSYLGVGTTEAAAKARYEEAEQTLSLHVDEALAYSRSAGLLTFVTSFLPPQQNPIGRLQDRYQYSNAVFFIEELNKILYRLVRSYSNAYIVDAEEIASSIGKRSIQDDSVAHYVHGSMLFGIKLSKEDNDRLEPTGDPLEIYGSSVAEYDAAVYREILSARRSLAQHDLVKLVIFDLDDTLWRGVAAERTEAPDALMIEGWPLGILEAVHFLAARGIMLAIVSKNEEGVARRIWNHLYGHLFPLDRFAALRINWKPKPQNIADIISLVNVRAEAVLFVDDNPVERAQVREALPGIRTLDVPLAEWRRTLLWAPELQPAVITSEATLRAQSIQQKEIRDRDAVKLDRAAFLSGLSLQVSKIVIDDVRHSRFPRCLELINKTNQYNTTGRRWTETELIELFKQGGRLLALDVKDKYSVYGVVAVAIFGGAEIIQYLMSCRVFGLGIEQSAAALICSEIRGNGPIDILGTIAATGKNELSLSFFAGAGFSEDQPGAWRLASDKAPSFPSHVRLTKSIMEDA